MVMMAENRKKCPSARLVTSWG